MSISTMEEKFAHELGDIYDAEHRFLEAQQEMVSQASDAKLKKSIQEHITQTEQQIQNLEQVFSEVGQKPKRVKCDASAGLVTEAQKTMKEASGDPHLLDCVIGGSAAKVEHYEIACYRGLVTCAELMGQDEVVRLLRQNLEQEEQTAEKVEKSLPALLKKAMKAAGAA